MVLMFKVKMLQSLYNLSDDAVEYQVRDRLSFMRFLGLTIGDRVPDAKTIWLFREELGRAGLVKRLFKRFDRYLRKHGFTARKEQIVDASGAQSVSGTVVRRTHGSKREKYPTIGANRSDGRRMSRQGGLPDPHQHAFGYKNHISVDAKYKLIRDYAMTDAGVHESGVFGELLDETNTSRDVWADSAYRSEDALAELERRKYREHLQRKGCRNRKLSDWEKQGNGTYSRIRCRIEHVFGIQSRIAKNFILRTIGTIQAEIKIGLLNLE